MKTPKYQEVLDAFVNPFHDFAVDQLPGGLINHSYKITAKEGGGAFLLQEINTKVFTRPEHVQQNYEMLWNYLNRADKTFFIPEPKYFPDGTTLYQDKDERYWRIFEFIDGAESLSVPKNIFQAREVAETFGRFTEAFIDFDSSRLHVTIPDFHNLSFRYHQFRESLHTRQYDRLMKAATLIEELKKRERYVSFYEVITDSSEFKVRVMHHDAKIANVLFSQATGKVICPVDLDTVMPGYFFSDAGDMIRSMVANCNEDNEGVDELTIRSDYYESIIEGYLSVMGTQLTAAEKKYIHFAGIIMLYMQALRFISDYLAGDNYYKTSYADQNLERGKNQVILLQQLEEYLQANFQFKV